MQCHTWSRIKEADLVTDALGPSRIQHGLNEAGESRVLVVASQPDESQRISPSRVREGS
jgi:hypothetical protein